MHSGSATQLQAELDRLTARSVPGIAAVVVREGEPVGAASAGLADIRSGAETTPDTVHLWFSMTKIVTATAVMQLAERGALELDDPVRQFVPEFPEPRSGWPEIRIRHLLSHSAGLANPIPVRWVHAAGSKGRDPRSFAAELLARNRKLRFPAGSKSVYSNLGYIVLGEAIGAAGGERYEEFVRSQILEPLALARTGFSYDYAGKDVATGYQRRLGPMTPLFRAMLPKGIIGRREGRFLAFNRFYVDGPAYGGLVGSAREAARFMSLHINDGQVDGVRLLQPESVREMQRIQASGRNFEAGLGWFRRGKDAVARADHLEHLGGGGGFWNMMRIYPERREGVLSMGNATRYDHESVARAVTSPRSNA